MTNKEFFKQPNYSRIYYALNALLDISEEQQIETGRTYGNVSIGCSLHYEMHEYSVNSKVKIPYYDTGHFNVLCKTIEDRMLQDVLIVHHNNISDFFLLHNYPMLLLKDNNIMIFKHGYGNDRLRGRIFQHVFFYGLNEKDQRDVLQTVLPVLTTQSGPSFVVSVKGE
tara:strand:+ start:45 stop:548 length:504 start_codon:yes stop_codon:yes gene_type:complete